MFCNQLPLYKPDQGQRQEAISVHSSSPHVAETSVLSRFKALFERFKQGLQKPSARKVIQSQMEQERFQKLASVLKLGLSKENFGRELDSTNVLTEKGSFERRVFRLHQEIERLQGFDKVRVGTVHKIREELNKIFSLPEYEKIKDTDSPHVNFIQLLALKLQTADGLKVLRENIYTTSKDARALLSVEELHEEIKRRLDAPSTVEKTKNVFWTLKNPSCAMSSVLSKVRAHVYRPFHLNPSHLGPTFKGEGGKTMQSFYAPSPTGDSIWEKGVIPAMKKMGTFELFFSFQDANVHDEKVRILQAEKVAKHSEGAIKHVVLGFDAKVKHPKIQSLLKGNMSNKEFLAEYKSFYREHCRGLESQAGMLIPQELLSDENLDTVLSRASEYFGAISEPFTKEEKLALIMGIDAMVANAILDSQMNRLEDLSKLDPDFQAPFVRACCKQHVDRGTVMLNAIWLMRKFRDQNEDGPMEMSQEEAANIASTVLGRALLVDHRMIIRKKADRLLDFMRLMYSRNRLSHSVSSHEKRDLLEMGQQGL